MDTESLKEQSGCIDAVLTALTFLSCGSQSKFRVSAVVEVMLAGSLYLKCARGQLSVSVSFCSSNQYSLLVKKPNCENHMKVANFDLANLAFFGFSHDYVP